jgi:hypothetical protein
MSHVDEGALHAYLDGALEEYPTGEARRIRAHLERCERCAEALTEARLIRDRAESILAAPELNVTPPPLEELKRIARSGAGERRASTSWGRRQRIGWAASVVVALGIGWIVRGGMPLPNVGPGEGAPTAEAMRAPDADVMRDEGENGAGALADAPSDGPPDVGPVVGRLSENFREPLASPAGGVVAEAFERSVPTEDRAVMAEARPAEPSPGDVATPLPAAPLPLPEIDATSVEVGQVARIDDDLDVPIDIVGSTFTPRAAGPVADLPAESAEATASAEGADTARTIAEDAMGADEPDTAPRAEAARLSLASRSPAPGTGLTRGIERAPVGDEAREAGASEPGSLVVPGLEVLSIVWREEGVVPAGVRVIQRLADGRELELIHLPAGFDPSAVRPAEAGVNELVVPRDQGWLILRAALEEPELRLLLERMDAPDPDR